MFKKISLINFQSHKKSTLVLHPNVNVIVGETDSGKSAILRALYWLAFGKPSGDIIRRWGAVKNTKVSVLLEEGIRVSKVRGDKDNYYQVAEEIYKGFGRNIPEVIANTLNVQSINFIRQLDPPFLFSMSAGEIASYLNKLVDLDIIGLSLSNISRMNKQAETEVHVHENSIENFQKQLDELHWIDAAEKDVQEIEKIDKRIQKRKKFIEELSAHVEIYERMQSMIEDLSDLEKVENQIDSILQRMQALQNIKSKASSLRSLISKYKQAQEALDMQQNYFNVEKQILKIQKAIDSLKVLKNKYSTLENIVYQVIEGIDHCKKICCEQQRALLMFNKQMPAECPLCGHVMKGAKK